MTSKTSRLLRMLSLLGMKSPTFERSRKLREDAEIVVEHHYSQLDGEDRWFVDSRHKDMTCGCTKPKD